MRKIPIYQPSLSGREKEYVMDCIDSNWISSKGAYVEKFEEKFADKTQVKYAASVSNGTVALHVALLALGIGAGDEVIVPTLTYVASVNAISYTGARPIFADSLRDTWQIDPSEIEKKITVNTKAILVVHLYGHPCDMDRIMSIAKRHNLFVVEDCAEAFGSLYKNIPVGGIGHIATFSFFGNKTITTGEGGMVITNDKELYRRTMHLKGQGLAFNRQYWHDVVGYNYRMTNICAAIGLAQLEQSEIFIEKKIIIAEWYKKKLDSLPLEFHNQHQDVLHTYWMNSILVKNSCERDKLRAFLESSGIETRPIFYPIHTMPMYSGGDLSYPRAEEIGSLGINLPSYPSLAEDSIEYIASKISKFYS
jgi:perosamine synthetase